MTDRKRHTIVRTDRKTNSIFTRESRYCYSAS